MIETVSTPQIWEAALGELQLQVNRPNYQTWLAKTAGLNFQDNRITIGVPSTFVAEYLEKNQLSMIERVLSGITHKPVQVHFQVMTSHASVQAKAVNPRQGTLPLFNPKYTFDSFVVGGSNQLAFTAAQGVAQNPGSYNPLFIFGGSGLGKTHLLQAIGNMALANDMKVVYVRAEEYTNQLVSALKDKNTEEFRNRYRSVDMLLVDDVQFFSGKTQTTENFFHTFDELHNSNRQIAVTSDRPPRSIPALQAHLSSRFEGGLVADIESPDFETRLAILKEKTREKGEEVSLEVLELIALQIQENIRALEGSLNRVLAYAKLVRSMLTPELASRALKDIGGNTLAATPPTPKLIVEAVVNSFQLTPFDLRGRKRDEVTALARQVAMYLMRQETDCSLAEIGEELGGRTPATVSHAYQKIASDIQNSPTLRRKVTFIQQEFTSHSNHKTL